jgi:hypothetical protein
MSVATSTAIGIGLAASAGASLASAKIQSNAAKNAAKTQQQGTDRALAVQQQANQPYMDLGKQAAARLASGQAMGQPYRQQFGGPGGSNGFQAFDQGRPMQGPPGTLAGLGQPPGPQGPPPQMGPPQGQPGPQMAMQGGGGGMVRLQAPDGSVSMVPEAMAQQFIAKGARRVG